MRLAVESFLAEPLGRRQRRVLILGDMLELGEWSAHEHTEIIRQAAQVSRRRAAARRQRIHASLRLAPRKTGPHDPLPPRAKSCFRCCGSPPRRKRPRAAQRLARHRAGEGDPRALNPPPRPKGGRPERRQTATAQHKYPPRAIAGAFSAYFEIIFVIFACCKPSNQSYDTQRIPAARPRNGHLSRRAPHHLPHARAHGRSGRSRRQGEESDPRRTRGVHPRKKTRKSSRRSATCCGTAPRSRATWATNSKRWRR